MEHLLYLPFPEKYWDNKLSQQTNTETNQRKEINPSHYACVKSNPSAMLVDRE